MESLNHKDMKFDIYAQLLQSEVYATIEKGVGNARPDILTEIKGYKIAIEVQQSSSTTEIILKRMREHTDNGYHTLWLIDESVINSQEYVKNLKWVNFIQHIQNGVLFVLDAGKNIVPARIDNSIMFKNGKIATGRKILDTTTAIEFEEIIFGYNNIYALNISTYDPWWINNYLDLF